MKPHLLLSKLPKIEGEDHYAPCGARVSNAYFLRSLEPGADLRLVEFRGMCSGCLNTVTLSDFLKGRYLAFAVDGETSNREGD
jgi:hypothetical protein